MNKGALGSALALLLLVLVAAGPSFGWFELSARVLAALAAAKLVAATGLVLGVAQQLKLPLAKTAGVLLAAAVLVAIGLQLLPKSTVLPSAEALYVRNCGACHGAFGEGTDLGPSFQDPIWLHGNSLEAIDGVVAEGVSGTAMVPWKDMLSEEDRLAVSVYVFGFQVAEQ